MGQKWSYIRRAYAIAEYAYLRQTEAENVTDRTPEQADSLPEVIDDIKIVLEMAEDTGDGRTVSQCRKFLADFKNKT